MFLSKLNADFGYPGATLTTEVETLKGIFCRNPILLKLEDEAEEDKLSQFVVKYVVMNQRLFVSIY